MTEAGTISMTPTLNQITDIFNLMSTPQEPKLPSSIEQSHYNHGQQQQQTEQHNKKQHQQQA
jgi:hypothetical protein